MAKRRILTFVLKTKGREGKTSEGCSNWSMKKSHCAQEEGLGHAWGERRQGQGKCDRGGEGVSRTKYPGEKATVEGD